MLDLVATETKPTTWRDRVPAELAAVWDKGLPFLLGGATVGGLAAANGGYFPSAWGWSSLALLWVVAAAIVVSRRPVLERLDLALIAGLLALLGWTSLSVVWSGTATSTVWETERLIVYVAAAAAALLILRKRSVPYFLGGMLLGITAAASYGLATRLYPDRFVSSDRFAGYRLAEPLGYWNAVGIFAALGLLLALGLAARAQRPIWRALAGASVAILAPTFFFTFSRGAWVALAIGLIAAVALDARRLQLVTTLFALAPAAVLTVWLGSRQEALTTVDAPLAAATREGHRLALYVVILAVVTAGLVFALAYAERYVRVSRSARAAYAGALVAVLVLGLAAVFVRYGSPPTLAREAWHQIHAPPVPTPGNLTKRLFSLSSNGRVELGRAAIDDFEANPIIGSGAGTFERYWNQHRTIGSKVRDAHSLYLETLGELGAVGLGLLVLVLAVPLVAVVRSRRSPLVSAAFGAYVAYLVHAGVDWDWEMTAITIAAVFCGIAIIVEARRREEEDRARSSTGLRIAVLGGVAVLAAFSFVGLIGNVAASRSERALDDLRYGAAIDAGEAGEVLGPVVRGAVAAPRRDPAHRRRLQARAGQPSEGGLEGSPELGSLALPGAGERGQGAAAGARRG